MDFRRLLPEIRWQSRLSPVSSGPGAFFCRQNHTGCTVLSIAPLCFLQVEKRRPYMLYRLAYRTATVTPPWLATPPTVNTTAAVPETPAGTTTFTCITPAISPVAPPA